MDELGYDAEWFLFNSRYHGVPQNRERVYTVGHFRNGRSAKVFPIKGTNQTDSVDRIDPECVGGFGEKNSNGGSQYYQQDRIYDGGIATSLSNQLPGGVNYYAIKQVGKLASDKRDNPNRRRVYDPDGLGATLDSMGGGQREPCIIEAIDASDHREMEVEVRTATQMGHMTARGGRDSINLQRPGSETRRGRVGVDVAQTLDTACYQGILVEMPNGATAYAVWYPRGNCYVAIRKLMPKECFRLQGFEDKYFDRAQFVNVDRSLYQQAGNAVTVNVVELIGKRLKEIEEEERE